MKTDQELKQLVKEKYAEIALQSSEQNAASCCGSGCCSDEVYNIMTDDYSKAEGYYAGADLGLGCGLPVEYAQIKAGDTLIDLGSGAGNDCFVARSLTGPDGKVIGIDFTENMIEKARTNAEKLGYNNVEFRYGDIEKIPVTANRADVIISNCVLNLVPDKAKVFSEIYRVLKPGGHFSISDIVLKGDLPEFFKSIAEMYAGCISGAIQKEEYIGQIKKSGFKNIEIQKEKRIIVPDDILKNYLNEKQIDEFKNLNSEIVSITVYTEKPETDCCDKTKPCC